MTDFRDGGCLCGLTTLGDSGFYVHRPGAISNFAERYLARPNMAAPDGKRAA